mgnify:CR=1 FL=1
MGTGASGQSTRAFDLLSCPCHQARGERSCGGNRHLLAEDGAYGTLERIPCTRNAQPRPALQQRGEEPIRSERPCDRRWVRGQIERNVAQRRDS